MSDRHSFRARLYRQLHTTAWPGRGLSPLNKIVALLICLAAVVAVLESEPVIHAGLEVTFFTIELGFTCIFLIEYIARLWTAAENPLYQGLRGRLRYAMTWTAIVDLLALLPILLVFLGSEAFLLRIFRLIRIVRVARLGRFSRALRAINEAIHARRFELWMSFAIAVLLLLLSSTLLYIVEGGRQPETFGSIPRAMWWSVATLTTVGYGDVYPVTILGRVFAGLTAITGIGLIAMPTGILASAFSDAIQRQETERRTENADDAHP